MPTRACSHLTSMQCSIMANVLSAVSPLPPAPITRWTIRQRRRCHWVTPTYDTLVWSPWTQVALFSTAAEGVAQAEQVGPRFSIFPNPVHDVVRVEAEVLPATLVLYDQQGRELYRTTLRDRQTTIGVGDLGRGVYHFSLTSTEGTVTKKRVVE